uniref:ATP synthase F0 subunit 8 n=1 Tax=Ceramothamnion japonicum TaxID=218448 RepID=A0A0E3DBR6_CERJP|nr:ATP synthase F0 subunit 8 [Ceramium japonicum]
MPQLDLTIIFPQIFWLFLLFSVFYFILTFYLLPKFLISLKLRQFLLEENIEKINKMIVLTGNSSLHLKNNIEKINSNFEKINLILKLKTESKVTPINTKLLNAVTSAFFFCDSTIFKNIIFSTKMIWRKK